MFFQFLPVFFILVWLDEFGKTCGRFDSENIDDHITKCLGQYYNLQIGLGKSKYRHTFINHMFYISFIIYFLNSRIYFCHNFFDVSNFYNNMFAHGGFHKCITSLWWRLAQQHFDNFLSNFLHLLHWISLRYHNYCRERAQKLETVSWSIEAKARYQWLKLIHRWKVKKL